MEDFNKKLEQLKSAVINEIKGILSEGQSHQYTDTFYCMMIDGDCAVRTVSDIIKNENGSIKIVTVSDTIPPEQETYDDLLSTYEIETIIYAYETLRKELRAHKIERIKQLVEQAGGTVKLDSTFTVRHFINDKWIDSDFPDDELDSLLAYIERETGNLDISLTDEQKEVLDEFNAAWVKLKESKVAIMLDIDDREFHFCNCNGFKFGVDWEGCPQGYVSVQEQLEKMPTMSLHDECYYSDNNEEIVAKRI